jgi:hypothetical protein
MSRNEMTARTNFKDASKPLFAAFGDDKVSDLSLPSSGSLSELEVLAKHLESIQKSDDKGEGKKEKTVIKGSGKLTDALERKRNVIIW